MDSFDHEMAGVSDEQILSYQATFPLDLSPLKDGMIRVEQASNQPVDLVLTRSSYSPSLKNVLATNETEFGQTIDFGFDYVQWNHVHLSGLDGSSLTITMEETTLSQQSTQESGELYSGGQGRLGMSMDEGWDVEDVWEFNNTEFATYYSVLLIDEEGTLDASLSSGFTKQVSQLRCEQHLTYLPEPGSGYFAPVQVSHREGSGQYTLEVQRGFAETCPSDVTIMAPNTISVDSDFRVKYESTIAYDVTMNIIDEELSLVYSTQIMDSGVWYPIIDLPDLTPGAYTLIARGHDNVVVAEQPLTVLSDPLITTYVTADDLDLIQTPKIFVNSHSPHSYVPQDWIMEDIVFSGVGADENLFSLEDASTYEGTGSGIVELDQLPPLLSGSRLMATATISSGSTSVNHSWFWDVGFIQPTTTCQTDYTISFQRPQNQLLCSVDFSLTTHGSTTQVRTEESFSGRLEVYNANGTMVADVNFQSDRFAPTPVRIDFNEIREPGTYQTSLVMDDKAYYYFTESTAEFNVNGYLSVEVESTPIGDFDFSLLPVRDRATAGDKVTFLWSSEGQTPDYLFVDVYTDYLQDDQELVYSKTVLLDGVNSGELQLTLPESVNPYLDHMIQVTAISEYGEAAVEYNELQGLPELSNLEVYINPTNPTIGDEFDVIVSNPSGGNWLSWEWELRLESSVIGSGNGFDEANKATISVDLPLAQYSSNPMFYISVETVDGTVHDITRTVNPLPMRTVQVEFKDSLVVGEEAEFEWRLEGIYLNQMDNIQKIDVVLYSLTNNLVHQEQYFGNATSGRELVLLPESMNPGTYNVVIRFSFADGTDYSHIETAQVLAEPEGINVLGSRYHH